MKFAAKALLTCLMYIVGTASLRAQQPSSPAPAGEEPAPPLPERNPLRSAPPSHPSRIAAPAWSEQEIQEAMNRCAMILAGTGAVYQTLNPLREGQCGAPAPIELSAIGNNPSVAITPPARVTCGMAASLSAWSDAIMQPAARARLNGTITGIRNISSYVCRNRYNSATRPISEHARANALDMSAFKTQSGTWVSVLDAWALPPDETVSAPENTIEEAAPAPAETTGDTPPKPSPESKKEAAVSLEIPEYSPESAFLYEIHTGACTLFGTALGPETNEAHKNHFHYDLAAREHDNYCR